MEDQWNEEAKIGHGWTVIPTNCHGQFEVRSTTSCVVNLHNKTCTCYQWQVRGFPCSHAVAAISRSRWPIREVVDEVFFTDTYQKVYSVDLNAIPITEKHEFIDLNKEPKSKILPPKDKRLPGRPRESRYRPANEPKRKRYICSRCGKHGAHYWITCGLALG